MDPEIFILGLTRLLLGLMTLLKRNFQFVRYSVGKLIFPALEPLFILRENLSTAVRRHFDKAIKHIENKNFALA
ncbi:MAG: hypothetical protein OEM27_04495, partial [Nitrospinota bacterium]|nr:hypothetical protein [Nitrospinota bacterium]